MLIYYLKMAFIAVLFAPFPVCSYYFRLLEALLTRDTVDELDESMDAHIRRNSLLLLVHSTDTTNPCFLATGTDNSEPLRGLFCLWKYDRASFR
ncbi:hypothetical protein BKA65DRAFT_514797 [Rhexocercosporidium sp. MPI-PUGE-AT-0058]|nr:hypothetical protein BKA65DRAFT_514797 [Rhexocercosporidium sp. MPI-PUGE-AT-0058]